MKRRAALLLLLAGCSGGSGIAKAPAPSPTGAQLRYVAVGASETVGFGADDGLTQSWPQLVFHDALPPSTLFTNLGIPGETTEGALHDELPAALALHPDVVTVWLNVNDALAQVTPTAYGQQLDALLTGLRGDGHTKVFVANMPPLDRLPAYLACKDPSSGDQCQIADPQRLPDAPAVQAEVALYNEQIAADAHKDGAILVDLHALTVAAEQAGTYSTLIGKDGFHPSTEGHRQVAAAFTAAIKAAVTG